MTASVNLAVAFPGLLLALFFAVIFGVGAKGAVLAIGLAGAPTFARLTQTLVASVAARDYVAVARTIGVGRFRILLRHVLPNIGEPLVVNATIGAGGALLAFAGLSFLGLGVQSPSYDWGRLLYDGIGAIYVNPAAALAPGHRRPRRRPGVQPLRGVRRQGPRHRHHRRRPPRCPPPPAATAAPTAATADAAARLRRPGARRPRPRGHLPGPARPDPPGARRLLLGHARGEARRHRGGVRARASR